MQRRVKVQDSLLYRGDAFDMWRDYMDLGRVLNTLCHHQDANAEEEKNGPPVMEWSYVQNSFLGKFKLFNGSEKSSSASSLSDTTDHCRFCKQNGESARVYLSHHLRSDNGKVSCPILREYICPVCKATGDYAHTRKYCPMLQSR